MLRRKYLAMKIFLNYFQIEFFFSLRFEMTKYELVLMWYNRNWIHIYIYIRNEENYINRRKDTREREKNKRRMRGSSHKNKN